MDFIAYHDRTSADHQAHFNQRFPQGYRMISVSVYGARHDERYAAVWVRRPGPDWSAVHGVDGAGYQGAFDRAAAAGFKPVLLSATGPADDPVFAGTFEQTTQGIPLTRFGLKSGDENDPWTIEHWIREARRNNWHPTAIAVYGVGNDLRFAGIWEANPTNVAWTEAGIADDFSTYQQRFDALVPAGGRPVQVAVSPDGRYASIFRDDQIGAWVARHGLTSAGYQQEFDRLVPQGFYPIDVHAPTTFFRQASVSKTIVALAVYRLIQQGQLTLTTRVQDVLHLQRPDGTAPTSSFGQVTVQHLLEHTSGLPNGCYGVEPLVVSAFNAVGGGPVVSLPVTGAQTDRYMITLPATPPPATPMYNNWGYFLLGHVVMAVTGSATLVQALNSLLFQPLGITRIRQARTRIEDQLPDEARYHATTLPVGPSMVLPDRRLMSSGYGGFWNLERDDAGGGLTGSVVDVARLLAMLDVRTNNPVLTAATIGTLFSNAAAHGGHGFDAAVVFDATAGTFYGMKGGDLPESSQNGARYQTGDLSMVVCWNRSDIAEGGSDGWWYPDYPALLTIARAQSWPTTDLFPGFGMPSLV